MVLFCHFAAPPKLAKNRALSWGVSPSVGTRNEDRRSHFYWNLSLSLSLKQKRNGPKDASIIERFPSRRRVLHQLNTIRITEFEATELRDGFPDPATTAHIQSPLVRR
ncbi:Uncharacterized protein TCM_015885 [Theobroma cacao]|uniref:Uncharacterized protein n=1 Tax=Theobroma cacao TaxID=3641 RepID=A0A061G314_THECC|nr:Uncharacterized protein TCM_015885 [Theobroma cacao]